MGKILRCRDVGVDCDFEARGETVNDVLNLAAQHAKIDHGMDEIPADLAQKVIGAIRDDPSQ